LDGARLETEIDVLFLEPFGELLNGDGAPVGIATRRRIFAIFGRGDDGDRPIPRLLAGEHGAWSEADAARSSPGAVLYNVSLAPTGQHAQSEAGQVLIPDEVLVCSHLGIYDALGEFRHRLRSVDYRSASCRPPPLATGSTMEARGRESRRVRAKTTVVAVAREVN